MSIRPILQAFILFLSGNCFSYPKTIPSGTTNAQNLYLGGGAGEARYQKCCKPLHASNDKRHLRFSAQKLLIDLPLVQTNSWITPIYGNNLNE